MARVLLPLHEGDSGPNVRRIQRKVAVIPDGDFGPVTTMAVRRWKTKHGLSDTGIVGPKTWARMFPLSNTTSPPIVHDPGTLTPGEAVLVKWLKSRIGTRYIFGAKIRPGEEWLKKPTDCSGSSQAAYRLAHHVEPAHWPLLPAGSYNQHAVTHSLGFGLAKSALRIGDLGFLHNWRTDSSKVHHVGVGIGQNTDGVYLVVEAKGRLFGTVVTTLAKFNARGADWHRGRKD